MIWRGSRWFRSQTKTSPQWRRPPSRRTRKRACSRQRARTHRRSKKPAAPQTSADEAGSAQGTVDVGYKLQWIFPNRGDLGKWEATVTRAGALQGKVVECKVARFTRVKWLQVYCAGREPPCLWHKATPLQLKESCRLYVEAHMAAILAELPAEAS